MKLKERLMELMKARIDRNTYRRFQNEISFECLLASRHGRGYFFVHMPFNSKYMQHFAEQEDLKYVCIPGTDIHGVVWGDLPQNPSHITASDERIDIGLAPNPQHRR